MKRQQGFGLLEILITMVVLGVAVVGLVVFSKSALVASQEGRSYEIAMRLAESKLDEFRNFNSATTAAIPFTAYNDISTNSTGTKLTQYGVDYYITWVAKDQFWNKASSVWQDSPPSGYSAPTSGQKIVTVTVTWKGKQLQLSSNISPGSSLLGNELDGGLDSSRSGPEISFNPGSLPDVVSTDLGDGNKKETSKPLPHISGNSISRLVQFDTATYLATGAHTMQAQQDTATVYCSCKYTGKNASNLNPPGAYLPTNPVYLQSSKVQYWTVGQKTNKPIGELDSSVNNQEVLCPSCCQDHYDVPSSTNFFEYYDPLNKSRTSSRGNGVYVDACRFIRIDGFYRPAPDWHLISLTTFSAGFLSDTSNLTNYQDYIADMVKRYALQQKRGSDWSTLSTNDSAIAIQDFNTWLSEHSQRPGSHNTALLTTVGTLQLISRGLYVDIMSPEYLSNVVYGGKVNPDLNDADLAKIPFQDVNMTLLSHWSSNNSNGTVTSQPIANIDSTGNNNAYDNNYYGTYSRGRLTAKNTTYTGPGTPATDQPITITVKSYKNNFGVVGADIPPTDNTAMVSTMQVSIQAPAQLPTTNINGVIKCLDLKTTTTGTGKDKVTVNSAVSCTQTSKNLNKTVSNGNVTCLVQDIGSPAEASYSCSGPAGSFFTLTFDKNKYQFAPASQIFTLPSSGTLAGGCVLMVSDDLRSANPAPSPAIPTSCNIQP